MLVGLGLTEPPTSCDVPYCGRPWNGALDFMRRRMCDLCSALGWFDAAWQSITGHRPAIEAAPASTQDGDGDTGTVPSDVPDVQPAPSAA